VSNDVKLVDLSFNPESLYSLSDEKYLSALIGSYSCTFNNSVYNDNFDYETAEQIITGLEDRDFEGLMAIENNVPVGFAFGYVLESQDRENFPEELSRCEENFFENSAFYFAELGVLEEYRNQGIGKGLKSAELDRIKDRDDVEKGLMRTSNTSENKKKLQIDHDLGFEEVLVDGEVLTETVEAIGENLEDERMYLWREV